MSTSNEETGSLKKEGDYWTIVHNGTVFRLRDAVGLRYIRLVLERPGMNLPALELMTSARGKETAEKPGNDSTRGSAGSETADLRAERARQSVQKAIRAAIERIAACNPDLGYHLETTVRTGAYCSYRPDPRKQISWRL